MKLSETLETITNDSEVYPTTESMSSSSYHANFFHLDNDELSDEALQYVYRILNVKWAEESSIFIIQKKRIEELEAIEGHLLESIIEMKRDTTETLKERIETLLAEKTNLLEINTYIKKQVAKLTSNLSAMTKFVNMSCTANMNDILKVGRSLSSHIGLGFVSSATGS